ncbi:MFS transporter [Bailinhaonella thermotolerans]|uniref:MFS transporter n=1 Tax=Bailinhaonella thermotolerans TaxID=1070861 RepID=A0A3A4B1K1_9ACTN|nr:MFS transporter [Bailinhaonella thermotolerans]RJL35615.1 MFS transporter [Bailinhaonella thermotolerans]
MSETRTSRWVVGLVAVSALLVGLDSTVVSTALTTVQAGLGASGEQLEWTVNAYTLSFAVLMLTAAALGDRFGRRRVFTAGLVIFGVASAACAAAPDIGWLIAARAAQGAGAAAVMPLALALLGTAVPPAGRARALGAFSAVVGASVPVGPLLGGAVVDGFSWRWIFWLNVPIVAVMIPLIARLVPESHGPRARIDLPGLALAAGAAFALVFGLVRAQAVPLIAGVALAGAFVAAELRRPEPMLPMRLFRSRAFSAGNASIFLLWASTFGSLYYMAQFLQAGLGSRPLVAGLQLVPWGAMTILVPRLAGGLISRYGERPFLVAGMALHGASMFWIAAIASPDLEYWRMVIPLVLSGAGVAAAIPATQSAVLGAVAPADMGKASGAYTTLRQLGGACGVAALVAAFSATGGLATPHQFTAGFTAALTISALLAAASLSAALFLPTRPLARPHPTPARH